MKYQQVSVDLVNMMMTACSYLALAGAAWVLLRLLQACFWLPRHFRKQNNVQKLLQDKVDSYEKYLAECEARDKLAGVDYNLEGIDDDTTTLGAAENSDKWRKQRESLEMLKKELSRVRDGINVTDWDYLLEESQEEALKFENGNESEGENEKGMNEKQAANAAKVYLDEKTEQEQEVEQEQEQDQEQEQEQEREQESTGTDGKKDK